MALVVEDGSIVAGANSYASATDIVAKAAARGVTDLPADDALDALIINATRYFESFRDRFKGELISREQMLSFPRKCLRIDGFDIPDDEIPREVINSIVGIVIDMHSGIDFMPTTTGEAAVVREKIGPLETQYAVGQTSSRPHSFTVSVAMAPLLKKATAALVVGRA